VHRQEPRGKQRQMGSERESKAVRAPGSALGCIPNGPADVDSGTRMRMASPERGGAARHVEVDEVEVEALTPCIPMYLVAF
jgi:hypothetical protein